MTGCAAMILLASVTSRTYFELARLQSMQQWWQWPAFALVCILVLWFVVRLYRRDAAELNRPTRWLLIVLRFLPLAGLLVFFLGIEKRTEYKVTKNSRAILAIDTSQSMGLIDLDPTLNPEGLSRAEHVVQALASSKMLDQLRRQHDVVVYKFDQAEQPAQIAMLPQSTSQVAGETDDDASRSQRLTSLAEARWLMAFAGVLLMVAALAGILHVVTVGGWLGKRTGESESWPLLVAVVVFILAMIVTSTCHLRNPQIHLTELLTGELLESPTRASSGEDEPDADARTIDWGSELQPMGLSTRLGDALQFIAAQERGGPVGGICLITDGNINAGLDWREALLAAKEADIPVFAIGVGTDRPPMNVRVVDIEAPARVYPGDAFRLTAFLQAFGMDKQSVRVDLVTQNPIQDAGSATGRGDRLVEERRVALLPDGEVLPLEFEVKPEDIGRVHFEVRVQAPPGDLDPKDNRQSVEVHVIDRKTRLLLFAGGPTREYQFLRTMAYRDNDITLDVLLQGAAEEIAQDADRVLLDFPATAEELFEYDAMIAFDPDWRALDRSQIELLERWVGERAGGLILVAGPVHTPEWTTVARAGSADDLIRALYPVTFYQRTGSLLSRGRYLATQSWPLELTDDGEAARFLWLGDSAADSRSAWKRFGGVYGYQPSRGAKPAATIYARFSNPETEIDGELPVFFAGQFYGAGRVFYIASGEMWRVNEVDVNYFDQFYTKLIRYVSEGRLLRDSSRGVLLVSKDRSLLGETIIVRASLSDAQFRPLADDEVVATLIQPDGIRASLKLQRIQEAAQEGAFSGQFAVTTEGDYRIELPVPDSPDLEILNKTVRARLPDREVESPQRNDAVLAEVAKQSGGAYFVGMAAASRSVVDPSDATDAGGMADRLLPNNQETYFPGAPDKSFQQRLMGWLIALICGSLSLEWLLRRLHRLA